MVFVLNRNHTPMLLPLASLFTLRRLSLGCCLAVSFAAEPAQHAFDVPAGAAVETLRRAAQQAGRAFVFSPELVAGQRTVAVRGLLTAEEAIGQMLAGSPLALVRDEQSGALAIRRAPAAGIGHGTIEGRVQNTATGQYLGNARVTVRGTDLSVFTDPTGTYRLSQVPAGRVVLDIFYTGLDAQSVALDLAAHQSASRDIELTRAGRTEIVKLGAFAVSASRAMDGAAIAINEQRFAPNIVNVVSADEFGIVPDGNIGEFLKMLPGITMNYRGGDPREISMNGVPSANVPVTIGGFSLATSEVSGTGRNVELNAVSINNLSRIEAVYSPTPESPGSALAGSINLVPRSAFERARPIFNGSVYLAMRDSTKQFHRSPGPAREPTYKVRPGFEFSWIVPVNKRFGFTVSAGGSTLYTEGPLLNNTWRGGGAATNGTTLPDTTPDRPYLSDFLVRMESKIADRSSFATTVDYRLSAADRLSFSFQYGTFHTDYNQRALTFIVNRVLPGEFSPSFTNGGNHRYSRTYMPTLTYRHEGAIWKAEAGLGASHAQNQFRNLDKGRFASTLARRTGVTVSFDDNFYLRPGVITVTDGTTGAPVDPYNINSYALSTAGASPQTSRNVQRTAFANVRRDFDGHWPLTLKAGVDVRQSRNDNRTSNTSVNFIGADGRATTTPTGGSDDGAGVVYDPYFFQRAGLFGIPRVQWVSNEAVLDLYREKPSYFTSDENARYRSEVNASKRSQETIASVFLRGDTQLFNQRLKLTGGLRVEQTNVEARGPLNDPTRNFQRDAAGKVILGANGRPLAIATDALAVSQLTLLDRGAQAEKEYLRLFPSVNASFNVRENLIARAAYYASVGRPNFNQYSGGVTLPDTEATASDTNRITVNNAAIKAWSARTGKVTLEYYFERVGMLSVGAFRRDFKNFFGSTTFDATPAFLALYGLDPVLYGPYFVATQQNITSTVRMEGIDVNYKQALTFLPPWARGVQVFANGSAQRATGAATSNFAGYIPRTGSWGISLSREKYNVRMNWNYLGRQRRGLVTGRSIEPNTYTWGSKRSYIDLTGEYSIRKHIALFANLRNLNDPTDDVKIAGPNTPAAAQFRERAEFGSLWTFGIKGTF